MWPDRIWPDHIWPEFVFWCIGGVWPYIYFWACSSCVGEFQTCVWVFNNILGFQHFRTCFNFFLGVPIPICLFTGSWDPFPECFLFYSSSSNSAFVSVVANELSPAPPWIRSPSSLVLTDTVFLSWSLSPFHSLFFVSSRTFAAASFHTVDLASTYSIVFLFPKVSHQLLFFLSILLSAVSPARHSENRLSQHCSTFLSLLSTTSLCNHVNSVQTWRSSSI